MATLMSVNVGFPRDIPWHGELVHTGIWKSPVDGPVMARRLNLDGDGQGDLAGHGGEQRAVMVYQTGSYEYWSRELDRTDLTYGIFGENFTVDGLPDDEVCIGDRYRIGEAEFEVTQPRTTCYRVGIRLREPQMAALLVAHHRPGFYLRVLREGQVRAGDEIVPIGSSDEQVPVSVTDALLYLPDGDVDTMRHLVTVSALSPGWRASFQEKIEQSEGLPIRRHDGGKPAWQGFRQLRVSRVVAETELVRSVYLRAVDAGPLPTPAPGQYITVRVPIADGPPPVRSYSLSASDADTYRISVKRERHGSASRYIATALAVGDELDVAAPRGDFVLGDGDEPVLLVSAGIGATPVLAMLRALADRRSTRTVVWLHTTQKPATQVFAGEISQLVQHLPNSHSHTFYTADTAGATEEGMTRRRLDRAALAELDLPAEASAYLCGPTGFMQAMTAALVDVGLAADRIHTEIFASLSAVTPGLVEVDRPRPHAPAAAGTGLAITFARAGITAAFDERLGSLLEFAEACDVPTRWSCRTGVCHTCATSLLSGAVRYSPLPLTEPDAGRVLLCCSTPQTEIVLDL